MTAPRVDWMNFLLTCLVLLGANSHGWGQIITTVAGGGAGDGGPATQAGLASPAGVSVDGAGSLYIADTDNHRIRRVDAVTGVITTVAGTGGRDFSGEGGPATQAGLADPHGVFIDRTGHLYIADTGNHRIRRVDAVTGIITTVAGTGEGGFSGDGGPATQAGLAGPHGVFVDGAGHLYIADTFNDRIRRVDGVTGIITTVAGTGEGGFSGDGGPATQASLAGPHGMFVDGAGHLYIADVWNHRIRRVDGVTGLITTVAGTGEEGFSGDGGPATQAGLAGPHGVFVDGAGHLYIAGGRVRRVDGVTGLITTVVGTGIQRGFLGDGEPATQACLIWPHGVFVDGAGHLYIADRGNHRIRRVDAATGLITTVAGTGEEGFLGDGGPATQARLAFPRGMFVDGAGHLYIADSSNNRIRRVDAATGLITTVAGTGTQGFSGDGGPAAQARLKGPGGVFVDGAGHLYIADTSNHRIRRVDAVTGLITTVAGIGADGFSGDGEPALQARLNWPGGVFVDGAGHLYIADSVNSRIRRVDAATGIITTVAGTGPRGVAEIFRPRDTCHAEAAKGLITTVAGGQAPSIIVNKPTVAGTSQEAFSDDGGPATQASLAGPGGVFIDGAGTLYIADTLNHRIRRVDAATGIITTVAGTGEGDFDGAFSGDGGAATQARLTWPRGVFVDEAGHLYIADTYNNRIRRVDAATGIITTVAGTGEGGFGVFGIFGAFSGDEGAATQARLNDPSEVFVDGAGDLYIADVGNNRIRKVTFTSTLVADRMMPDQTATAFALAQNYPNPFNPHTRIGYHIAPAGPVSLTIYNLLGQRIRILVQQPQAAGFYQVRWDGTDASGREVADGVYVYRLASRQGVLTRRMLRLK